MAANIVDTERTVIAVLLNDSHAIIPVLDILDNPEQFSDGLCRSIYAAILDLTKASVVPNVYTVADKLPAVGVERLQEIGRRFNTKVNREVLYLADIVAKHAKHRRIIQALDEAREMADKQPDDLDGLAFTAMQMVSGAVDDSRIERDPSVKAVGERLDEEIIALNRDGLVGYSTGSQWLDDKTGGLCPSHVWVISGPYKFRKTTLARNLVLSACRAGASVSFFALEGDQGGTYAGLLAMLATDRLRKWQMSDEMILSETFIRRGWRTEAQARAIAEARKELDAFNLRIYDGRDRIGTPDRIAHKVKRDRFMFGLNAFFVDYLQLLGSGGKLFDRVENATHVLQRLIIEEGVTGVILAQLNEATIYTMDDDSHYSPGVKGGGDVAAAADFLLRTKYDSNMPDSITVQLKLARHAQPGKRNYRINPQSGLILGEKA